MFAPLVLRCLSFKYLIVGPALNCCVHRHSRPFLCLYVCLCACVALRMCVYICRYAVRCYRLCYIYRWRMFCWRFRFM